MFFPCVISTWMLEMCWKPSWGSEKIWLKNETILQCSGCTVGYNGFYFACVNVFINTSISFQSTSHNSPLILILIILQVWINKLVVINDGVTYLTQNFKSNLKSIISLILKTYKIQSWFVPLQIFLIKTEIGGHCMFSWYYWI